MAVGQKIALGWIHARQIITVHVDHDTMTIDLGATTPGPRSVMEAASGLPPAGRMDERLLSIGDIHPPCCRVGAA